VIDGLGRPQRALVVGGTSEIGLAICRELAKWNPTIEITLAGRSLEALQSAAAMLSDDNGSCNVEIARLDLDDVDTSLSTINQLWQRTEFDLVLLTAGVLPEPEIVNTDPRVAVSAAMVNFVGQLAVGTFALQRFDRRGSGYLVVISSVAAERIRPDNYVYGSTKAGLDGWAVGAAHARRGSPVRVLVVRPGMVRTRMSAGMPERPLTTDAVDVAKVAMRHLRRRRSVVWSPPLLKHMMRLFRLLPNRVFFALSDSSRHSNL